MRDPLTLRSLLEDTGAATQERVQAAVMLLEHEDGQQQVDLDLAPELITAVAQEAGHDMALCLALRLSSKRQQAGYTRVVEAWPHKTPQELSLAEPSHRGFTTILARLGEVDHVYGSLVAEYRENLADPVFQGSPMFMGVWGRHLIAIFDQLGEEAFVDWLRKMWWVDRSSAPNIAHIIGAAGISAPPDPLRDRLQVLAAGFEYPGR
jgi:hypothetical protein